MAGLGLDDVLGMASVGYLKPADVIRSNETINKDQEVKTPSRGEPPGVFEFTDVSGANRAQSFDRVRARKQANHGGDRGEELLQ